MAINKNSRQRKLWICLRMSEMILMRVFYFSFRLHLNHHPKLAASTLFHPASLATTESEVNLFQFASFSSALCNVLVHQEEN